MRRLACWTRASVAASGWTRDGVDCATVPDTDEVLAARAYIQGRGGDPCVRPLGVPSPPAAWDIGVAVFPTKARALVTGYVDDAPATECYGLVDGREPVPEDSASEAWRRFGQTLVAL